MNKIYSKNTNHIQILDLGSGSGCIGLSIIDDLPNASLLSLDICNKALEQVNINAQRLNLRKRLHCAQINWFEKTWIQNIKLITENEKLFSKNKFAIVISRKVGTFFIGLLITSLKCIAVLKIKFISDFLRYLIPKR